MFPSCGIARPPVAPEVATATATEIAITGTATKTKVCVNQLRNKVLTAALTAQHMRKQNMKEAEKIRPKAQEHESRRIGLQVVEGKGCRREARSKGVG